jgi:hypothetical protein
MKNVHCSVIAQWLFKILKLISFHIEATVLKCSLFEMKQCAGPMASRFKNMFSFSFVKFTWGNDWEVRLAGRTSLTLTAYLPCEGISLNRVPAPWRTHFFHSTEIAHILRPCCFLRWEREALGCETQSKFVDLLASAGMLPNHPWRTYKAWTLIPGNYDCCSEQTVTRNRRNLQSLSVRVPCH